MRADPSDPRPDPRDMRQDIRPVVAPPRQGMPVAVVVCVALAAGLLLFTALNARRQALVAPATKVAAADRPTISSPPPLYVPPAPVAPRPVYEQRWPPREQPPRPAPIQAPTPILPRQPPTFYAPQVVGPPTQIVPSSRGGGGPTLVIDNSEATQGSRPGSGTRSVGNPTGSSSQAADPTERARAGMFANPSYTVPQGTLIPVVLETGFDSTRPGFARALVQRDVRGFDGSEVLIPRGSRLIGEYGADAAPGQNRAGIVWSRLIRPDGVTIDIASPAADPVGRGGVRAKVNSHFWERFGSAILQSSLDIGVNLASRAGSGSVIVLPGGSQAITGRFPQPNNVRPTLSVSPGTSVSVFVARDLDFKSAQGGR